MKAGPGVFARGDRRPSITTSDHLPLDQSQVVWFITEHHAQETLSSSLESKPRSQDQQRTIQFSTSEGTFDYYRQDARHITNKAAENALLAVLAELLQLFKPTEIMVATITAKEKNCPLPSSAPVASSAVAGGLQAHRERERSCGATQGAATLGWPTRMYRLSPPLSVTIRTRPRWLMLSSS